MKEMLLGDICEFKYGKSLPAKNRIEGEFSVFGSNGKVGSHKEAMTQAPTIVIGRKGSVGEVHYTDEPCWPIDTTFFIDPTSSEVDLRWLYHSMRSLRLNELNKAAAVPGLNRNDAYEKRLIVPGKNEQRRIAAILDKADAIRRKREQALDLADDFLKSAYVYIVGHLNPEHADWEPFTIEQLAEERKGSIRSGPFGSALRHGEFVDKGIAVLGIDNAVQNRFAWGGRRFITKEKYEDLRRYRVFPNDVIITIMGTTGRSAVVPEDIPEAITTKHLAAITCDTNLIHPEVLSYAIHSDPKIIQQVQSYNKGAIMDGLNLGTIRKLILNRPPMEEQLRFVSILKKVRSVQGKTSTPEADGSDLFQSLSQRAFRGEL
jgi:type I restriction enzyme, S subunit